jgi:hypothetical protein
MRSPRSCSPTPHRNLLRRRGSCHNKYSTALNRGVRNRHSRAMHEPCCLSRDENHPGRIRPRSKFPRETHAGLRLQCVEGSDALVESSLPSATCRCPSGSPEFTTQSCTCQSQGEVSQPASLSRRNAPTTIIHYIVYVRLIVISGINIIQH